MSIKMLESNSIIFAVLIVLFVWLLPFLAILTSSKTRGGEKVAWLLAVVFISWFAWVFFLLVAPLKKRSKNTNLQADPMIGFRQERINPNHVNINQRAAVASLPVQGKTEIAAKPNLQAWLKSNPGKSINDYFIKFGK